jgi:hypothetical protein
MRSLAAFLVRWLVVWCGFGGVLCDRYGFSSAMVCGFVAKNGLRLVWQKWLKNGVKI